MNKINKIAIHSVPRSGSSWIGQIFNSSPDVAYRFQPLFSYAFKDYLNEDSSKKRIETFFRKIAESDDDFLLQKDKVLKGIYPLFKKNPIYTHVVYKEVRYHNILANMLSEDDELKVIGIIRNPYAVINSFLQAPREFRRDLGWNELQEWRYAAKKNMNRAEEFYGYEKWKEVVLLFRELREKYPSRLYILYYDELLKDPLGSVGKIFSFCSLPLREQTIDFLYESRNIHMPDPYSVFKRRSIDNRWKNELNPKIVQEISIDLKSSKLEEFIRE